MKNLFALLALLAAVSVTACDDCAAEDAGTSDGTESESTCLDAGMGGSTTTADMGGTTGGGTEGGTGGTGGIEVVSCSMPASTGTMSIEATGECMAESDSCDDGAGTVYSGASECTSAGNVCCIKVDEIQRIQDATDPARAGGPVPCVTNGGFCVDTAGENDCTNVEGSSTDNHSGECPGSSSILCCR